MHHAAASCHIGFDVGGTGLKAALVNPTGQILETVSAPTPAEQPPDVMIAVMEQLIQQLLETAQRRQLHVAGVGVGLAGLIDAPQGVVITAPNLPAWDNVPLVEILSQRCGLPVAVDNDVRAMALGELAYGAGQGCQHLLCVTVGTGVGSAIVLNGQIHRGASLTAGELGHLTVVPQGGRTCGCGNRGCLETVAGTEGILSLARRQLERGLAPRLASLLHSEEVLTPRLISEAALAGDPGALAVWEETGHWLGLALAGVVNLLNPERIVIGGGVAQAGSLLLEPISRAIRLHAFARPAEAVRLVPAQLGAQAGMIGSAVLAQQKG